MSSGEAMDVAVVIPSVAVVIPSVAVVIPSEARDLLYGDYSLRTLEELRIRSLASLGMTTATFGMTTQSELVTLADISAARDVIRGRLHYTPTSTSRYLSDQLGVDLHLKLELFQKTGSFKPRGVLNRL